MKTASSSKATITQLSPKKFTRMKQPPLLIDVRSQVEYATGHAPDACNLSLPRLLLGAFPPLRRWLLPQWFRELPKDQPVAVICLTSHRSPIAASQLVQAGFTKVFNVSGGMMEWNRLRLETRTGKPAPVPQ